MAGTIIRTGIDTFFAFVKENREVTIDEASRHVSISPDVIESWAKALEEVGLVSVQYPLMRLGKGQAKLKFITDNLDTKSALKNCKYRSFPGCKNCTLCY